MLRFPALILAATVVAAPFAIKAAARAAEPAAPAVTLYDAAGAPVAVLTPLRPQAIRVRADTAADPMLRLVAEQDAIMQQMFARVQALADAAFTGAPFGVPGSAPLTVGLPGVAPGGPWLVAAGPGVCSRVVTWQSDGNGPPRVTVRQSGDGCGALPSTLASAPSEPPAFRAVPDRIAPATPPWLDNGRRVIKVDYRVPAAAPRALHG